MSVTSYKPALKNVDAAKIKMAALTKKAAFKAIAESIRLYLIADQIPFSLVSYLRVCTNDECKYKLCGITVAPIIPIAMYNASSDGSEGTKPFMSSPTSGFAQIISNRNEIPIINTRAMMN